LKGEAYHEVLGWLLDRKRNWLRMKGRNNDWVQSCEYESFLQAFNDSLRPDGMRLFALRLNGKLIAAELGCVGHSVIELFLSGYDPEFAQFSPGSLLLHHILKWSFNHHLVVDIRIGDEEYKRYISNDRVRTIHYRVALNGFGAAYLATHTGARGLHYLRNQMAAHVPKHLRVWIKRKLAANST